MNRKAKALAIIIGGLIIIFGLAFLVLGLVLNAVSDSPQPLAAGVLAVIITAAAYGLMKRKAVGD